MKVKWTLVHSLILGVLLSSTPRIGIRSTWAAEPQVDIALTVESLNLPNSTNNWHVGCVERLREFDESTTDRSFRLDGEGHPHIAYSDGRLYHAWHDGTQWQYETVDEASGVGAFASLALDGLGQFHISYYDVANDDLKYAWSDGTVWRTETVDSVGNVGRDTSLALDKSGQPHITYYDGTNGDLKYARRDGENWTIETADSAGNAGQDTSLVLDGMDRPHVSYCDNTSPWPSGVLKYAWHDGTGWQVEAVNSEVWSCSPTSLTLDETSQPRISYLGWDWDGKGLKYAWYDGTDWQVELVEIIDWTIDSRTSIAFDRAEHPHISYSNDGLRRAWHDGTGWQTEAVDSEGGSTSLVLDGDGHPHIGSLTRYRPKYARHDGTGWLFDKVDSGRWVDGNSLALDGMGLPHISYTGSGGLAYARYDGSGWQTETVDSYEDIGELVSLVLDRSDRPHISYAAGGLKYARYDGSAWHIETVANGGEYASLALDRLGRPHISYYYDGDLKYAWYDGSNWQIETVDSYGDVGEHTSLALDRLGRPHISYYYDGDLKYAWYDGSRWRIEAVDRNVRNVYVHGVGSTSLALDSADRAHIGYYDDNYNYVKYAQHDGTDWRIERVDDGTGTGDTSLALDRAGRPHISYTAYGFLKYARHNGTDWHIERVDSGYGDTSLALDGAGHPYISLSSRWNDRTLKLIRPMSLLAKQTAPDDRLYPDDVLTYTLAFADLASNVRLRDPLPDVVHYVPGSIAGTVTPPAIYDPAARAIVWQGTLPTGTVQVVRFQITPDITVTRYLSSPLTIVNTAWLTDVETGRSITATTTVKVMPPLLLLDKQVTSSASLRNHSASTHTLTYTLTITGPGLPVRLWDPLPVGVDHVPGSVTSTLTPPAIYSPTALAVVWQGTLPTDTAHTVRFQVTPGITDTKLLSSPLPIVNTTWLTDTQSGRVITATAVVTATPPPLVLNKRASPSDNLHTGDTLTYILTLFGPDQSVRLWDPLPSLVRYVPGSITGTVTPAAIYSPTAHAVAWEGTLPTGTIQTIRFQVRPATASTESLWPPPSIVNTAWLTNTESSRVVSATIALNEWRVNGNWRIGCVDCPRHFSEMTNRSLRLDVDGHPHIAYGGDHLYYAWSDGTEWTYETVDGSHDVGRYASLALDGAGRPHISYYDGANSDLKYAWHDGMTWHIETVDSGGRVGVQTSLALDGAGRPHIGYCDGDLCTRLKYAWHDGVAWHIEVVGSGGLYASLALDGAGRPHITYSILHQGILRYAWRDELGWHVETVDEGGIYSMSSSLVLYGAGQPHVSYSGVDGLEYAWRDETGWHTGAVDGGGAAPSLMLDGSGHPHIGYSGDGLKYAWHDGMMWHVETLDSGASYTSLVLDGAGEPHISYCADDDLKYVHRVGQQWDIQVVDSDRDVGEHASLALDAYGRPHISYHAGGDVGYAYWAGSAWDTQTVDGVGGYSRDTSLALDATGYPHISYIDVVSFSWEWYVSQLRHAYWTGSAWVTQTVDGRRHYRPTPWLVDDISLALDSAGYPHISYHNTDGLNYARWTGSGWTTQTVDTDNVSAPSLVLDAADRPHISYCRGEHCGEGYAWGGSLRYAHWTGDTWDVQTVDSDGYSGEYTSIALDSGGRPHISYYAGYPNVDLKYAWYDGADWRITTVDSEGFVGQYTSLALDAADQPHISYRGAGLKYAWHDGADWRIETVDDSDRHTSLALDALSRPHISYYDGGRLKYAIGGQPLSLRKSAAPSGDLSNNTLAYTLTLFGPGLNVRLRDPLPSPLHYVPDSIAGTVTPPAVYSPTIRAVVWQGTLPTDTVETIRFQATPGITLVKSLAAPQVVINTGWLTATESGRVITATASTTLMPIPLSLDIEAAPRDSLRQNDLLTYTLTMSGPGLRVRLWDPLPPMVRYVPGSIAGTLVPTSVYSPTAHAIAWEGTLPTDTVKTIRFQVTPGITGTGSLDLSGPIVNTAWLTATESGRGVWASVIVNGYRIYVPLVLRGLSA